ncbi:ABC transporter permease subunit [Salinibacterium sp. NSLL150]|uniref:ABC transporter permease n=1 Tax=unclassified Salinibacterium TaxID=2632331 RepID=UPI0018CE6A95|nr:MULTISPECIES: ABC transporter permease subunit [unclassified Salinibacterium]MBH0097907.1 ABC transporter permease subunit [Salinibacterium sp. NSLL35]MBH0100662.1 ABC transporter permease subunit [Salinibacterium sp. NSLL150]MBH0103421.1 ABC transporter permease subunit [Salinibacterium sp. NSLL16]MBH0106182.1 ABC transporter permease subunit [Salinibacterium sp. NSLL17]MBH0116741.1 ABC transporter permease subunit [Salinibacterium sp. NG253]
MTTNTTANAIIGAGTGATRTKGWSPRTESILRVVAPVTLGIIVLAIWQFLVTVGGVSDYLLPSPTSIMAELVAYWPAVVSATVLTGTNSLLGLLVGSLLGIVLAAVAARWRIADQMSAPIIAALAVVPIVALAPVLNSMFGADSQFGRQAIAAIASFVPIFINTLRGFRQTRPVHRDLMKAYAASSGQMLRSLTLPTARPFILTGIRIASSLAVISALVAEYFGGPRGGLGSLIATSAASSAYSRAWAYVGASIALGLLFYLATLALERLVLRRVPTGGSR